MPKILSKKEVLTAYIEIVVEELFAWVDKANDILADDSAKLIAGILRMTTFKLRNINTSIDEIKSRIHNLYLAYKDLEKEHELTSFSVQYFVEFSKLTKGLIQLTNDIAAVSHKYSILVEGGIEENLKIHEYVTPLNQKSIELLKTLKDNDLLNILEKGNLTGL